MRRPGKITIERVLFAVCPSSMAKCYVCHRRRPYIRVWRAFDARHIAARKITFVGSLGRAILASGGNASLPACGPAPLPARNPLPFPTRPPLAGWPSALTLDPVCALPIPPLPIRSRRWSRAHPDASPLRRLPSRRGSCFLRSRSPRHASRRVWRFPSVGRRGWSRSAARGPPSAECGCKRLFTGCAGAVLLRRENKLFNIEKV